MFSTVPGTGKIAGRDAMLSPTSQLLSCRLLCTLPLPHPGPVPGLPLAKSSHLRLIATYVEFLFYHRYVTLDTCK